MLPKVSRVFVPLDGWMRRPLPLPPAPPKLGVHAPVYGIRLTPQRRLPGPWNQPCAPPAARPLRRPFSGSPSPTPSLPGSIVPETRHAWRTAPAGPGAGRSASAKTAWRVWRAFYPEPLPPGT